MRLTAEFHNRYWVSSWFFSVPHLLSQIVVYTVKSYRFCCSARSLGVPGSVFVDAPVLHGRVHQAADSSWSGYTHDPECAKLRPVDTSVSRCTHNL